MRRNPSPLKNALKNKILREIYDRGFSFYYNRLAHDTPTKIRRAANFVILGPKEKMEEMWLKFPREVGLVLAYQDAGLPEKADGLVGEHKETELHRAFISVIIRPLPKPETALEARRYLNTLRGMYDHEFVHVIQRLQRYGRGRRRWDKKYPNTMEEHKPHLDQLLAELRYRIGRINDTPLESIFGDVFSDYVEQVEKNLKIWRSDTKMRKMILKDIWKSVERIKASPELKKKLKKAGFPI